MFAYVDRFLLCHEDMKGDTIMRDETEGLRRAMVNEINGSVKSDSKESERERLKKKYPGQVWDTDELGKEFNVVGFMAPFCVVMRKSDGVKGTVEFQHSPRLYFNFTES